MSAATKVDMQNASDFKMMDRKVVESILSMPERNMFFKLPPPGWDFARHMWSLRCRSGRPESPNGLSGR